MSRNVLLFLVALSSYGLHAQEICDNGSDDDADGLIDLNDTADCACVGMSVPLNGILPNPNFEDFDCIPQSYTELGCAGEWDQGTFSTADYFMVGGFMPSWIPQPLPGNGIACVGGYYCHDYMEYVGVCLESPLYAGVGYTLSLHIAGFEANNSLGNTTLLDLSPVNVTVYGLATCPNFPTSIPLCPGDEGWMELGHATYAPSNSWSQISISVLPDVEIEAIMLGSPCTLPEDYPNVIDPWLAYFIMDELSISTSGTIGAWITGEGNWCNGDLVVTAHPDSTIIGYQWYLNGVAIPGALDSILAISALALDSGDYTFRAIGDTTCTLSTWHVETAIDPPPYIALTADGLWCPLPGTYQWFLNGTPLPGATGDYHVPNEDGLYTVLLTNMQGCSTLSLPFDWLGTAIAPMSEDGIILLFSPEDMTLRVRGNSGRSLLTVCDASGRLVISADLSGSDRSWSLANTAHGIYVARLNDRTLRFVR